MHAGQARTSSTIETLQKRRRHHGGVDLMQRQLINVISRPYQRCPPLAVFAFAKIYCLSSSSVRHPSATHDMAMFPKNRYSVISLLDSEKSDSDGLDETEILACPNCCRETTGFRWSLCQVGTLCLGWIVTAILAVVLSISWWSWYSRLDRICLDRTSYPCV